MEHVAGVPITAHCRDARLAARGAPAAVAAGLRAPCSTRTSTASSTAISSPATSWSPGTACRRCWTSASPSCSRPQLAPTGRSRGVPGPLTPNYASPEQLRGLPVTTASDVYALGVLLTRSSTGARPYETSGKTLDDVLEMVLETEPTRPSATARATTRGRGRRIPHARLKGDLDAIVLKAMSKAAGRRYGSAGELADDLERFLTGRPVVAREPSIGYLLRRMAAGNRAAVAIAAAAVVAILAALGVALWQRSVAVQAQARAERRFRRNAPAGQCAHLQDSRRDCSARGVDACAADDRLRGAGVPRTARGRI